MGVNRENFEAASLLEGQMETKDRIRFLPCCYAKNGPIFFCIVTV